MEVTAWLSTAASLISVIVATLALITSRNAVRATKSVEELDRKIELALSRFREEINKERIFATNEVIDYRFKGVDNSLRNLDHRLNRNSQQITLILGALLKSGVEVRDLPD